MLIVAVVLHFGSSDSTSECLDSLLKLNIPKDSSFKIILVDNDPENRFDPNKKLPERVQVVVNEQNFGYSEGNNVGIRQAMSENADYVMILNNDTKLDKNCLINLVSCLENANTGAAVPKIYFEKGYEFHKERYKKDDLEKVIWYAGGIMDWENLIGHHRGVDEVDNGQYDKSEETQQLTGCCVLLKRQILEKVGLFDKKYFLYYEDADLSVRIKKAGYNIIYCPKALAWHKNAGSSGSGSILQDYYITRNRLLFGSKYASARTRLALLREALKILISGRKWQKKGIKDFFQMRMGKGSFKNE